MRVPSNDIYVAGKYLIPATRDAVLRIDPAEGGRRKPQRNRCRRDERSVR